MRRIVRRNAAILLAVPLGAGLLGGFFASGATARHEARIHVLVQPESGNRFIVDATRVDSDRAIDAQVAMAASATTAERAAALLPAGIVDVDADWIASHSSVATRQRGGLIEITAWAADPSTATAVVDALARAHVAERQQALEAQLTAVADGFTAQADAVSARIASGAVSGDELKASQSTLEELLAEAGRARVDASVTRGGVSIVDQPQLEELAVGADAPRTAAVGVALGLLVGSGLALGRERLRDRLASAAEVEAMTGLPVLAEFGRLGSRSMLLDQRRVHGPVGRGTEAVLGWTVARTPGELHRIAILGTGGPASAAPTAFNVASCLAQRQPVTLLAASAPVLDGPGFQSLVEAAGRRDAATELARVAVDALHPTVWPRLEMLSARSAGDAGSATDRSATVRAIDALAATAECVVVEIDEPLRSPTFTMVAGASDAVILVATLDRTRRGELLDTIELLHGQGIVPTGVVVQRRPRRGVDPWTAWLVQDTARADDRATAEPDEQDADVEANDVEPNDVEAKNVEANDVEPSDLEASDVEAGATEEGDRNFDEEPLEEPTVPVDGDGVRDSASAADTARKRPVKRRVQPSRVGRP